MATQSNSEICPVCGNWQRDPQHPMCRGCNIKFGQRVEVAQKKGEIMLVTRMEFASIKGANLLVRLQKELSLA